MHATSTRLGSRNPTNAKISDRFDSGFVLRLRKLALKESREYARQLGKLYSDRTRMENRPRMKTRKEMAASRKKMAHEARIITSLKATAKAIVRS
eukprot:254995-Amorphochlora_amoeboformis.AAC.1